MHVVNGLKAMMKLPDNIFELNQLQTLLNKETVEVSKGLERYFNLRNINSSCEYDISSDGEKGIIQIRFNIFSRITRPCLHDLFMNNNFTDLKDYLQNKNKEVENCSFCPPQLKTIYFFIAKKLFEFLETKGQSPWPEPNDFEDPEIRAMFAASILTENR